MEPKVAAEHPSATAVYGRDSGQADTPELQVLICTYGEEGMRSIARANHPAVPGVEYVVCWQLPEGEALVPVELRRPDFKIYMSRTRGLALNRNMALSVSTAPLLLISDDDLIYTARHLGNVLAAFEQEPHADIICFMYESEHPKRYPESRYQYSAGAAKGHYITSFEIAMRADGIRGKMWFDTRFGIGGVYPMGEEDIFMHTVASHGLKAVFVPNTIARHDGPTSCQYQGDAETAHTKGAVFYHLFSLPQRRLRMLTHAWRARHRFPMRDYVKAWLQGEREEREAIARGDSGCKPPRSLPKMIFDGSNLR